MRPRPNAVASTPSRTYVPTLSTMPRASRSLRAVAGGAALSSSSSGTVVGGCRREAVKLAMSGGAGDA
jgi:hypothetical protein